MLGTVDMCWRIHGVVSFASSVRDGVDVGYTWINEHKTTDVEGPVPRLYKLPFHFSYSYKWRDYSLLIPSYYMRLLQIGPNNL